MQNSQLTRRNFLLKLGGTAGLLSSPFILSDSLFAATAGKLTGAKLSGTGRELKVSFNLSAAVQHKVFTLKAPERVVIDLMQTSMEGKLKQGRHDRPPLKGVRYAQREGGFLRIVLDLSQKVSMSYRMRRSGGQHVLDINLKTSGPVSAVRKKAPAKKVAPARNVNPKPSRPGNFVVVIDPGHGGRDPGAVGRRGTREKDVVLAVSRKLKARIDATPGMRAIMTRSADKYVPLRKRIEIARKSRADLFISVHADANNSSRLNGSSVYILSENGASSEAARLLAKSENSYERKLGYVPASTNDRVASILMDLSQNETLDRSLDLANSTLKELARVSNPLRRRVESAGFVVLKAPDIPSMLVETAFISNPREEKRLRTSAYQQKLADAMFRGVKRYQQAHAPGSLRRYSAAPQQRPARSRKYIVRSGDSLSKIADRHGVSVTDIKRANRLNSTRIRIGQTLRIPANT